MAGGPIMEGLSLFIGAVGQSAGLKQEAAQASKAADIGRLQATQLDTAYRDDLSKTIANIKAIRAATGADPNSPTTQAYIADQTKISDRNRDIKTSGLRIQTNQSDADATFFKASAKWALLGGVVGGLNKAAQVAGQAAGG